ncbi:MAG: intracellular septation protein [Rhodobacteraceae bacterium]|uniref:inner membrane-spanning protein YciB n=1 Tax=Cypionkella sp. TaxID=2811411 RepID=UPI0013273DB7|nr:inner membrane-spanning protein YciB [Cypionkella sp.]KAF0173096.1 MAG: intracellular septation protein [Paracoccaceae bacterium]MDO8327631.1 inner membrane-spanning protein YciB [Cypionkella sp.]
MAEAKVNPMLKLGLELGPIVLFFAGFRFFKDKTFHILGNDYSGFIVMTAIFVVLIMATTAILWKLTGHLSKMQLMTLVLVIVMGGLSVWLNDERFIKMKPTLLYLAFGGLLGIGLLRGQSYLKLVMEEALPMQSEGWMILTRRLCAFFFALALANEVIWRTLSTEAWVNFKTFGLTIALFGFFLSQSKLLQRYALETPPDQP